MANILSSTLRQTAPPPLSMSRHGGISNETHHRAAGWQTSLFAYGAGERCTVCCSGDMKDASPLWAERLFDDAEDEWNQKLDSVVLEREQLM